MIPYGIMLTLGKSIRPIIHKPKILMKITKLKFAFIVLKKLTSEPLPIRVNPMM